MILGFIHRFWKWVTSPFVRKPKRTIIHVVDKPMTFYEPDSISPTKAYFDQRQKAASNRRRKPSKAMRNLYKLSARAR